MARPKKKLKFVETQLELPVDNDEKAPVRKNVLKITPWLYIVPDPHCWVVKEIKKDGRDVPILYFSSLAEAIKGCMRRTIKVPMEIEHLNNHIEKLYSLIDARIPPDIHPRDLFILEEES